MQDEMSFGYMHRVVQLDPEIDRSQLTNCRTDFHSVYTSFYSHQECRVSFILILLFHILAGMSCHFFLIELSNSDRYRMEFQSSFYLYFPDG